MKERGSALYQLTLVALSVYVLIALVAESFFVRDEETRRLLQFIDLAVCVIFLVDFFVNLTRAESKKTYLKWGWIDFISSIPMIDPLRWGRLARVARILRVFRAVRSVSVLYSSLLRNKARSLTLLVFSFEFFSYTICAAVVLDSERAIGSGIQTAEEALWWTFLNLANAKTSITNAASAEAAIAAIYLNKVGLVLFAYFNAMLIAWLMQRTAQDHLVDE